MSGDFLGVENVDMSKGEKLSEGKTKILYQVPDQPHYVLIESKNKITAFNAVRQHELEGKAKLSNITTCKVFQYLNRVGFPSHFVRQLSDTEFLARKCQMIPIEWVARRIATGSFLKRNQGVPEGYRFCPPKLEMFYKDDAAGDPQWSEEMLISSHMTIAGVLIDRQQIEMMAKSTVVIFEVLEKAWSTLGCSLIDMKVEFGVLSETGEIVLADVIDNDSWRLWPGGDRRLQLDKQFYRDLPEVTENDLKMLKEKFAAVIDKLDKFITPSKGRVVVMAGSPADEKHCNLIKTACSDFGIPCFIRFASAHKNTSEVLKIAAEYEGDGVPTVFIAVAGLSNGLGPVLAGNISSPVINCPPVSDGCLEDVWSSLRLPSGMHCATVLSPVNAVWHAASILACSDHMIWSRIRSRQLQNAISLMKADKSSTKGDERA